MSDDELIAAVEALGQRWENPQLDFADKEVLRKAAGWMRSVQRGIKTDPMLARINDLEDRMRRMEVRINE